MTDGGSRAALAVTRSLGRAGYSVVVGEQRQPCLAGRSKHCADAITYPDPARDEARFLETLETTVRRCRADVLLPVADTAAWLIAAHRERFEPACIVACPSLEAVDRAADKAWVVEKAMRLDIPVPRTVFLDTADRLDRHRGDLVFPVVVKPRRSRVRTPNGWLSTRVSYAHTWDRLVRDVAAHHALEFPLLLQERISGPGVGVFACMDDGKPIAWFAHRRLREKPPTGGVSVLCESRPLPAAARTDAERLLAALDWRGPAMVEFKEDRRDGVWKLMEVNGRFWGSLQLAIDAGVDFPALWIDRCLGRPLAAMPDYRVGVRSRWFWGDVDALLVTLRRGEGTNGQGRVRTLLEFLKMWSPQLHYENPRLSDVGPWLHETRKWLGNSVKKHG